MKRNISNTLTKGQLVHTWFIKVFLGCQINVLFISLVQRFMKEDRLPHLLFYGPPGTGKTSTILACAKTLYKPKEFSSMVLEVIYQLVHPTMVHCLLDLLLIS